MKFWNQPEPCVPWSFSPFPPPQIRKLWYNTCIMEQKGTQRNDKDIICMPRQDLPDMKKRL